MACCNWCDETARHLGTNNISCDTHKPFLIGLTIEAAERLEETDEDHLDSLYDDRDIGCYCVTDGCSCDSWV